MEPLKIIETPTSAESEPLPKRIRYEGPVVEEIHGLEVYDIPLDSKIFIFPDYEAYKQDVLEMKTRKARYENKLNKPS